MTFLVLNTHSLWLPWYILYSFSIIVLFSILFRFIKIEKKKRVKRTEKKNLSSKCKDFQFANIIVFWMFNILNTRKSRARIVFIFNKQTFWKHWFLVLSCSYKKRIFVFIFFQFIIVQEIFRFTDISLSNYYHYR